MPQRTAAQKITSWAKRLLGEDRGFGGEHQIPKVLEETRGLEKYSQRLRELPVGHTNRNRGMAALRLLKRALSDFHPEWNQVPPEWDPDPEELGSGIEGK